MTELDLLRNCRRLFLRDFEVRLDIGVHAFEKVAPQRLLVDVDLYVKLADSTPQADVLAEVVDYDFVRELVHERISRGHIELQETLADDLLAALLAHPKVHAARLSTRKPDVYSDCASVGVEVFGSKAA